MSYYPSYTTLKCFETSARRLSFTHAAIELSLTQGAVSHHILKLEKQLAVSLFNRRHGKLDLTEAGERFLREVRPALDIIERASDNLRSGANACSVIRVAVPPTFAEYWLMSRLNQFTLTQPGIKLQIMVCSGDRLNETEVDVGFELSTGVYPQLESIKILPLVYRPYIARSKLSAVGRRVGGSPSKRRLLDLLSQHDLLQSSTPGAWQGWLRYKQMLDGMDLAHVRSGPRYATASLALQAAVDGLGVALLPDYVLSRVPAATPLVCLDKEGWLSDRAYYMRWRKDQEETGALRQFIAWAHDQLADPGPSVGMLL